MSTDIAKLRFEIDSSGLKVAQQEMGKVAGRATDLGKRLLQIGTVAAASGTALVGMSLGSARELQNLARTAGTTSNELRKLAFGSDQFGISQEKLSDILKDFNDRVGDFNATGAGPMVDFFENIAPRVGVTADQFARLSGPQALQLYVSSLEKANLSQQDMTFYMETMASDSTRLLPLLRENGALMNEQAAAAESLGYALSNVDYANMTEARNSIAGLGAVFIGVRDQITAELSPYITAVANQITKDFAEAGDGMRTGVQRGVSAAVGGFADVLDGAATVVDFVDDNPDMASFGLVGYLLMGRRGAAIGGVLGVIFTEVRKFAAEFGIGISDANHLLNQRAEINERIGRIDREIRMEQERINNLRNAGIPVGQLELGILEDMKREQVGLFGLRERLTEQLEAIADPNTAVLEWNEQNAETTAVWGDRLRDVAALLRGVRAEQDAGGDAPVIPGTDFSGLGGGAGGGSSRSAHPPRRSA